MKIKENAILRSALGDKDYLTVFDIPKIESFANDYFHNTRGLYDIYSPLMSEYDDGLKSNNQDNGDCIIMQISDGKWSLRLSDDDSIELPFVEMKDLLSSLMDIQERILPLGTVVDLKKDFVAKKIPQIEALDNFRVVITHRFLSYLENVFYPYAGVLYPAGMLGRPEFIHFSYSMIETVIQEGFSDELEQEYVNAMKNELLVEKKMHSAGFATEEEIGKLAGILEGRNE